jgi:hypothetical protein
MSLTRQLVFVPGPEVDALVQDFVASAVDIASGKFGLTLDFSEASIAQVEAMATTFHARLAEAPAESITHVARSLGSYVVEVFRRRLGGSWGLLALGTEGLIGCRASEKQPIVWPWHLAFGRITSAPDLDLRLLYRALGHVRSPPPVPNQVVVGDLVVPVARHDEEPADLLCSGCHRPISASTGFVLPSFRPEVGYCAVYRCKACAPNAIEDLRQHLASSSSAYVLFEFFDFLLARGMTAEQLGSLTEGREPMDAALGVLEAMAERRLRVPA